jgi:hypothetical protein
MHVSQFCFGAAGQHNVAYKCLLRVLKEFFKKLFEVVLQKRRTSQGRGFEGEPVALLHSPNGGRKVIQGLTAGYPAHESVSRRAHTLVISRQQST